MGFGLHREAQHALPVSGDRCQYILEEIIDGSATSVDGEAPTHAPQAMSHDPRIFRSIGIPPNDRRRIIRYLIGMGLAGFESPFGQQGSAADQEAPPAEYRMTSYGIKRTSAISVHSENAKPGSSRIFSLVGSGSLSGEQRRSRSDQEL